MTDPIRIGVIGAGAITQVAHLPALRKLKGVEVRAICDADSAKAQALGARYGIPDHFDDIEDLLEFEALDAVAICTPSHLHEAHIVAALSAGLHVLVERPLALSAQGVQRIARAQEKRDRLLMVGMNHRYRPDVQVVRSFVQAGELGEVESVRATWHMFRPARGQAAWRQRRDQAGGGAMLDLGLSLLDLGLWLANNPEPARVSVCLDRPGRERAVEQSGTAFVVCRNGCSIYLDVTWHYVGEGERFAVALRGSRGSARVNPIRVFKEIHGVATDVAPTASGSRENPFTASYRAEWAHFLSAIRGESRLPPLSEFATLHRVMEAIYRSAEEGRDVLL